MARDPCKGCMRSVYSKTPKCPSLMHNERKRKRKRNETRAKRLAGMARDFFTFRSSPLHERVVRSIL